MLIRNSSKIRSSRIIDKDFYFNRRKFFKIAGGVIGNSIFLPNLVSAKPNLKKLTHITKTNWGKSLSVSSYNAITSHNNFYEFGTDKSDPKNNSHTLKPKPWSLKVSGHAHKTGVFNLEDILKVHQLEERIYRMRCVEAWSMVIPWVGIPLGKIIEKFEPTSKAKFIAFKGLLDTIQMPKQKLPILPWPYMEGLRIDEAVHPLTILAVGVFGEILPNQNGAPLRLVVPWKYGFKGIKSIVEIKFTKTRPPSTWNIQAPNEYGFYSNVNPEVDHPRWSQQKERLITGEGGLSALFAKKINTLPFNGYGEEVSSLYSGMDLKTYF